MISRLFASVARKRAANPFPDFDKILDFTSAGSESSVTLTTASDTDKEYWILARNPSTQAFRLRLNNDSTAGHYGYQYIDNPSGSITAGRSTGLGFTDYVFGKGEHTSQLLMPTGFVKTAFYVDGVYTSGTTMAELQITGHVFNSTSEVTSFVFTTAADGGGNFTSGTRIIVYRRRVN